MRDLLIGIDIGTTAVKAAVLSTDGAVLSRFAAPYATTRAPGGVAEQDPEEWVRHVRAALDRFAGEGLSHAVAAIGLCGQVNTHAFLNAEGRPVAPAILWQDGRAAAEAAEIDGAISDAERLAWFGAPMPVDASHAVPRMRWMARHRPALWNLTRHVMLPRDYVLLRLTGTLASDPLSQIGMVGPDLRYVEPLLDHVPGGADRMPPLAGAADRVGTIGDGPFAGCPVACGTMDAWAGLVGAGAAGEGRAAYLGGTSEILGVSAGAVHGAPGAVVFPEAHGIRLHAAPTQSGGDALRWFADAHGISVEEALHDAFVVKRANVPCVFLPQLQGERAPLWDASLRGGFIGLDRRAGRAGMARAVLEGVAFAGRWAFDTVCASAGVAPETVACGGGGFRSDGWAQLRSDVFGLPFARIEMGEPGVLGAAVFAGLAAGFYRDIGDAARRLSRTGRVFEPRPDRHRRYTELFGIYKEAVATVGALGTRVARATDGGA